MAHRTLGFQSLHTGTYREAPIGFSWTTVFFNGFVPLYRTQYVLGLIMLGIGFLTYGLSGIVFAFFYNKMYVKHLIENGFRAVDPQDVGAGVSQNLGFAIPTL